MEMNQRVHAAVKLRAEFHRKSRLRLEYLAAMSRLLREHDVAIDDESLANLVPADISELYSAEGGPRPGGPTVGGPRPGGPTVGGPRPSGPTPGHQ